MARTVKCPGCGADLTVKDDNRDFMFCEFCGTKIRLDDYQETHRFVDEARIQESKDAKELELKKMEFEEGDTVMDVLKRTGVDIDVSKGYVAGIDGLYEFDCGKNSGWMYRVNGKFPNYMAGKCKLHDGDKVEWLYTCVRGDL